MFKQLRTVIYHASDLQKARDWYALITGIQPYFDEPFYVGFNINGFELGLDPDSAVEGQGSQAVAYWSVDGIRDRVATLTSHGAVTRQEITDVGGGIQVAIV